VNQHAAAIAHVIGTQVVHAKQAALKALLVRCEQLAEAQAPDVIKQAHARASSLLASEANRLSALQRVNPSVRDEEIAFYKNRLATLDQVINTACMRLDALRVIIAT
jgi:ATP-dependent helicase HepA